MEAKIVITRQRARILKINNHENVDDQEEQFLAMREKSIESIATELEALNLKDDDYQLPAITCDMDAEINKAMQPSPTSEILAQGFGINITRKDIETLAGLNQLNDQIINFYTNLLMERGKEDGCPSCYAFNTFFYSKLISSGHELLLVPVHLGLHWCSANIPQQTNGSDCGIFICKYAEYTTRNAEITFTQDNTEYFRRRMIYEIIKKKLL